MTKKMIEYRLIQLNLVPCFNGIGANREKMDKHYYLALEGLKKLNSKELDALNNVIESINHKTL